MAEKKQKELTKEQERMLENVRAAIERSGTKDYELLIKMLKEDEKANLKATRAEVVKRVIADCKKYNITATELRSGLEIRKRGRKSEINYIIKKIQKHKIKGGKLGYTGDYRRSQEDAIVSATRTTES